MPVSLEIVSPEKLLLSRSVDMVVLPAAEGDMGVLEGHSPMIVTLRGGTIALYEGDHVTDQLFVSGGFAEVTGERCTVAEDAALDAIQSARAMVEAASRTPQALRQRSYLIVGYGGWLSHAPSALRHQLSGSTPSGDFVEARQKSLTLPKRKRFPPEKIRRVVDLLRPGQPRAVR